MNLNKLMQQAQAMQNKMHKLEQEFNEKTFNITYNNADFEVALAIKGNLTIEKININDALWKTNDSEAIVTILQVALNQSISQIVNEKAKIMPQVQTPLNSAKR